MKINYNNQEDQIIIYNNKYKENWILRIKQ